MVEFNLWRREAGGVCIGDKSRIFIDGYAAGLDIGPLFYKNTDDVARHMKSVLDEMEGSDGGTIREGR